MAAVVVDVPAAPPSTPKPDRILRRGEVEGRVGLSRSTIYRHIRLNKFPPPVELGGGSVGWRESVIDRYVATRPVRAAFR